MLLSEIRFSSLLAYSPRGSGVAQKHSRTWTYRLKDGGYVGEPPVDASTYFVGRLVHHVGRGALPGVFGSDVHLVPMPGHAPWIRGGLWVTADLTSRMCIAGLGTNDARWLSRSRAVAPSRTLVRTRADEHWDSLSVSSMARPVERIVVVDDVITRGATALAAVSRLRERLPDCDITVFAMIRTISDPDDFQSMLDPCSGSVQLQPDGSTVRIP